MKFKIIKATILIIIATMAVMLLAGCAELPEDGITNIEDNSSIEIEKIINTMSHHVFYFYDKSNENECYVYYQTTNSVGSISCIKK